MTIEEFNELYEKFYKIVKENPNAIKKFFDKYFENFVPIKEVKYCCERDWAKEYIEHVKSKHGYNF